MKKLEDVMTEEQFEDCKKLASKMLAAFEGKQYTSGQIMLAAAMLVGGFVYKDINTEALLDSSANFFSMMYKTSIKSFRVSNNLSSPTPEPVTWAMPPSETVN